MPIDYDRELNAEQRAAALAPDGPVLVIAAAGTGKTRTLTYRVAHLVERGVPPDRILLLTFTNRAAQEMLERARVLVGERVGSVWGGTFHHFAHRVLRRCVEAAGLDPGFAILDEDDAVAAMRRCTADLRKRHAHFPKPEALMDALSLARNRRADPLADLADRFADLALPESVWEETVRAYAAAKRELRAVDFDDLLERTLEVFERHPAALDYYQRKFLHVLVDEYQDTNPLQARLVDLVAGLHRNLLVVGDDFQSIYAWRGADYRNFLSFPQRYSDARVFFLETNYRSVPGILAVANASIAGNPDQFQKTLRAVRTGGEPPVRVRLRDGQHQARWVVGRVANLLGEGIPLREMAVLYRSHFHALELQMELARAAVPYSITSGVRFFEQAHIKDALAPLRLAWQPSDTLAFARLAGLLPRVGERTARSLWATLGGRWSPLVSEDLDRLAAVLPEAARTDWAAIADAFRRVDPRRPADLLGAFRAAFYDRHLSEAFEDPARRQEDLEELERFVAGYPTLGDFLHEVALLTNVDTHRPRPGTPAPDRLLLSTVHQAKGLEWRAVFLLWMDEGMFPAGRALEAGADGAAEERRLFYVAVTRARDLLCLCVPKMRRGRDGRIQYFAPSRFLEELPAGLARVETPPLW